jgi:Uma2 family endonuclease
VPSSSTTERARRRATYDDLLKVPEPLVAEIIEGELVTSPRPAVPHARAASVIAQDVGPFDREPGSPASPGGWWMLFEPELHLDEDVLVPDLAGWRRERMAALPNAAALSQAPDWLCEVVSPATGAIDRGHKMRIYARHAVEHLWIVDPVTRTLEVYRLEGSRWAVASTHGGQEVVRAEPFDAIEIDIGRWWLEQTPPVR